MFPRSSCHGPILPDNEKREGRGREELPLEIFLLVVQLGWKYNPGPRERGGGGKKESIPSGPAAEPTERGHEKESKERCHYIEIRFPQSRARKGVHETKKKKGRPPVHLDPRGGREGKKRRPAPRRRGSTGGKRKGEKKKEADRGGRIVLVADVANSPQKKPEAEKEKKGKSASSFEIKLRPLIGGGKEKGGRREKKRGPLCKDA